MVRRTSTPFAASYGAASASRTRSAERSGDQKRAGPDLQPGTGLEAAARQSIGRRCADHWQDDPTVEGLTGVVGRNDRLDLCQFDPSFFPRTPAAVELDVGTIEIDRSALGRMPYREYEADFIERACLKVAVTINPELVKKTASIVGGEDLRSRVED